MKSKLAQLNKNLRQAVILQPEKKKEKKETNKQKKHRNLIKFARDLLLPVDFAYKISESIV